MTDQTCYGLLAEFPHAKDVINAAVKVREEGYLRWDVAPATSERGGQPKRRFEVTPEGLEALRASHEAWLNLTDGLDDVLGRGAS